VEVAPAFTVDGLNDLLSVGGTVPCAAQDVSRLYWRPALPRSLRQSPAEQTRIRGKSNAFLSQNAACEVGAGTQSGGAAHLPKHVAWLAATRTTEELLAVVSVLPILNTPPRRRCLRH